MNNGADRPQMVLIRTHIVSLNVDDAEARAHTYARNAIAHDIDRIAAARNVAVWLTLRLNLEAVDDWVSYCDSVGGILSERS